MVCVFIPGPKLSQQDLVVGSIEAPFALLQKPVNILGFDPVELPQVPLRLVPEVLNAVDRFVVIGKAAGMVDAQMMKIADVQRIISPKGIGVHDAVRLHMLPDNRQEAVRVRGRDNRGVDLPAPLQQPENHDFARGAPPASAFACSAEITLVGLDFSRQPKAGQFACDELAQPKIEACRRVAMDPNDLRGRSGCSPGNEQLQEGALFMRT